MIKDEETVSGIDRTPPALDLGNTNNSSDEEDSDNESSDEEARKVSTGVFSSTESMGRKSERDLKEMPTTTTKNKLPSSEVRTTTTRRTNTSADRKQQTTISPNPLTTILSNTELLEFVSQPLLPSQVFQCTIMRDKRGIDRSLYPTYFMYLQSIVRLDGQETEEKGPDKSLVKEDSLEEKILKKTNTPSTRTSSGSRQVFLMCGRRRKKSKTYLMGLDPFDISRVNSVAKLKSNIIGTEFRAFRSVYSFNPSYNSLYSSLHSIVR